MQEPHQSPDNPAPRGGLSDLSWVSLPDSQLEALRSAEARCGGNPAWRGRKLAELRDLLALAEISAGRVVVLAADLAAAMRALVQVRAPIPTMPEPGGPLVVRDSAILGITFPEQALRLPMPGYAFVSILAPAGIWHPNVAAADPAFRSDFGPGVPLCLGASIPASTRLLELVLRSFAALVGQSVQLDPRDAAGLMNPAAASWYLANRERMPLTREGLIPNPPPARP